jgi:hypothetical protein
MKVVTEFTVHEGQDYWVTVKAWPSARYDNRMQKTEGDRWNWNVYAHFNEKHKLFDNPKRCKSELYFNCGCTFDELKTIEPSDGIIYDWQKVCRIRTYGSDYAHIYDNYDNHPSPAEGIPSYVLSDTQSLIAQLERITSEDKTSG